MKKARRTARELALNVLYQSDAARLPINEALETALEFADYAKLGDAESDRAEEARNYARVLVRGVVEHTDELDGYISSLLEDWALDRQPVVDRNVLRIAMFEIKYLDDVPPAVSIDEAVELAKKFSTAESGKFVNGVLAGFLKTLDAPKEDDTIGSTDS